MGDVLRLLNGKCEFMTMDGVHHEIAGEWGMIIAHPPCTYRTVSGNRYFNVQRYGDKAVERIKKSDEAAKFFMRFVYADCEKIAIENPVGRMNTKFRKPDQIIHPYMFADGVDDVEQYVTKATCLWLKGLPKLKTNGLPKPDNAKSMVVCRAVKREHGQIHIQETVR